MKRILFFILLIVITFIGAKTDNDKGNDSEKKLKELFLEAESGYLYEEYTEALPLYLRISKVMPENANINYKIGVCYLNIPYEKEKSISYLEKAVTNINLDYKFDSYKETGAPYDALFYLGNAYRVNNQLDLALKTYQKFKTKLDPMVYDEVIVNDQIKAIEHAHKLIKTPLFLEVTNLGENVNTKFADFNPVISYNGKVLAYNVTLQFYDALYIVTLNDKGEWGFPINIIPDLGLDGDVYVNSLNFDGTELYLYRSDSYDGNLYVTRFNAKINKWSNIIKLNENINTKYWESHACISANGQTLYFTSNRKGSIGGLDIYKATRNGGDNWQNIVNLGPEINTDLNEETPFVSDDEKTLWFSSYGHYNMGGYDIFYASLLDDNKWSVPLNIGYPINTTDDDVFFCPTQNGNFAYISRYYPNGFGKSDIYRLEIYNDQHPRKFKLKGMLSLNESSNIIPNTWLSVKLVNSQTNDTIQRVTINPAEGKYILHNITSGKYKIIIAGANFETISENFSIDKDQSASEILLKSVLKNRHIPLVEPVIEDKLMPQLPKPILFSNSFYKATAGTPISINFKVIPGANVAVSIRVDSILVKTSEITNLNNKYRITYIPVAGRNVLKFKVTNPNLSIEEGEVLILCNSESEAILSIVKGINIGSKRRMTDFIGTLSKLVPTSMQAVILDADIEKNNISSPSDFQMYLKNKAQYHNYSAADVDKLFALYSQLQAQVAQNLSVALQQTANGKFSSIIDTINWNRFKLVQPSNLANILLNVTSKNKGERYSLITSMGALAFASDLYYVQKQLAVVATDRRLRTYIESTNFKAIGITDADDLFSTLLKAANRGMFPPTTVYLAFASLPVYTHSAQVLLSNLISVSDVPQNEVLKKVDINKLRINTSEQLITHLLHNAPILGLNATNLIRAYLLASYQNHLTNLFDKIQYFSEANLHKFLNNTSFNELNISTIDELLSYLINNAVKNKYTTDDLLKVLTHIAADNQGLPLPQPSNYAYNHFSSTVGKIQISIIILLLIVGGLMLYKGYRK